MKRAILSTLKSNRALASLNIITYLGIVALSLHIYTTDLKIERERLLECQGLLTKVTATEGLHRQNIEAAYQLQYEMLDDLRDRDYGLYWEVMTQIDDPDDYLAPPKTKLITAEGKSAKVKRKVCEQNIEAHFATFRKLNLIFNDTHLENKGIMEVAYPENPNLRPQNNR